MSYLPSYNKMNNKPKPTVTKIEFTPEQIEEIKSLLQGGIPKETIEAYKKRGWNLKNRIAISPSHRNTILKKQYFGGTCHSCSSWPDYKLTYQYDGAILKEYYCNSCYEKHKGESN
jgi:hypothetical protein